MTEFRKSHLNPASGISVEFCPKMHLSVFASRLADFVDTVSHRPDRFAVMLTRLHELLEERGKWLPRQWMNSFCG